MTKPKTLDKILGIKYPFIIAPMFLVSNTKMVIAALESGISAAIPALNYRTDKDLRAVIKEIKSASDKPFGFNLIVNKSNPRYKGQLKTLVELKVDYIITSLGNPKEVIEQAHKVGTKVFCDVVDLKFAKKVEALGADAIIAVNSQAGGHAGNIEPETLIKELVDNCEIPVITAGGVSNGYDLKKAMRWGAAGASMGTLFIASTEADVSDGYKQALVEFGKKDIVRTDKLSGTPLTVIKTPYIESIGTKAGFLEQLLLKNKWIKKYVKLLIAVRGLKKIEKAAKGATYKTVWVAGPSIEAVKSIRSVKEIAKQLIREFEKRDLENIKRD